jgi:hypothetical protein
MGWFKKHKILTVILVFLGLIVIGAATGGGSKPATPASSSTPQPAASTQQQSTEESAKPAFNGLTFYDKIQNGMTKAELISAAGKDPDNCSESQMQGAGKYENCTWYDGSFSSKFVTVSLTDDKVSTKSKYGY